MKPLGRKNLRNRWLIIVSILLGATMLISSCKRSDSSGSGIFGPADETLAAGDLIAQANEDLKSIKVLYKNNEGKREELKKAMENDDPATAKQLANEVINLINQGTGYGNSAVEKLQKAQEMQINDDYRNYLGLKESALKRQLEAFDNYLEAAKVLRDNYDPKNTINRDKVKQQFATRSEDYRRKMDEARQLSNDANLVAKQALAKQTS